MTATAAFVALGLIVGGVAVATVAAALVEATKPLWSGLMGDDQ